MRSRGFKYFLVGLVMGAAVGIVGGMLLAPSSGVRTRREIADRARRAAESARIFAERAEGAAETLARRVDHYLGRDQEVAWRKVREIRDGVRRYTQAQHD